LILCRKKYAEAIDRAVFPGLQGGPHNHTTAALAVALKEAGTEAFKAYAAQIVENAKALAAALVGRGFRLVSGGTDNHLIVVDTTSRGLTGRQLSKALNAAGIVCNFNRIPFDARPAANPSGIRLGTPAVTSRGFGLAEMEQVAAWIDRAAAVRGDPDLDLEGRQRVYREISRQVRALCDRFPAPGLAYDEDGKPV
jgi:glycine hydroxymethyltransferase